MPEAKSHLSWTGAFDAFAGGVGFIIGTPRTWPLAALPAAIMTLLTILFTVLAVWGSAEFSAWVFGSERGTWGGIGYWVVVVLLVLVLFLIGVLLALLLAEPLAALALERISQAQQRAITGSAPPPSPLIGSIWMNVKAITFSLALGGPTLLALFAVNLFFPPAAIVTVPLKLLVFGWMLAWDFIGYPMGLRKQGLRARLKWVFRNFGAFTLFGLMWAFCVVVPGVVLVLLPMGVAGATRMVLVDDPRPTDDEDQDAGSRRSPM